MDTKASQSIDKLSTLELNSILEHLRLGDQHLKKLLTEDQYQALQYFVADYAQASPIIAPTRLEHIGNIALVINTIISSTFGSWLAMAGVMGFGAISISTLMITISIAFTLSLVGALASYNLLNRQADEKLKRQQVLNLQAKLLDQINTKRTADIMQVAKELKRLPSSSSQIELNYNSDSIDSIMNWVTQIEPRLNNKEHPKRSQSNTQLDFVKTLAKPRIKGNLPKINRNNWIQARLLKLVGELLGITIGGFASTFVYTTGIPDIVKQLGYSHLHALLVSPFARGIELIVAVLLTSYFAFSYLYANQKNFQRDSLLDKTDDSITREEANMIEKSAVLNILQKIRGQFLRKMASIKTEQPA